MRAFVGLSAQTGAMAADASTWNNTFGLCKDSADSNWHIIERNSSTSTKTDTGCACTAGQILDLYLFCKPFDSGIYARLIDAVTGTVYVDNVFFNTTPPSNVTFLYMHCHNQSQSGTTAKLISLNKMYLESDI